MNCFDFLLFKYDFSKIKKAGSLTAIVLKHLRPITLRPTLSDSLPFSTLQNIYSIYPFY